MILNSVLAGSFRRLPRGSRKYRLLVGDVVKLRYVRESSYASAQSFSDGWWTLQKVSEPGGPAVGR